MTDWLVIALCAGVGVVVFLLMNQQLLSRKTVRHKPPLTTKWLARHPDGQVSKIEYFYTNENGKKMWKFAESEAEVHAEFWQDIIVQDGAWSGDGYFIFRKNRGGSATAWQDPKYFDYFSYAFKLRQGFDEKSQANFQRKDLEKMAKQSYKKMLSDGFDEEYAESQYGLEKKLMQYWLKGGRHGSMPPFVQRQEGEQVGETQSD